MLLAGTEIAAVCAAIPAAMAIVALRGRKLPPMDAEGATPTTQETAPEAAGVASRVASLRSSAGFAKVAEWLATPGGVVPATLLLVAGQVLPLVLLWVAWNRTLFIIPFLGPPIRIGMEPVRWAVGAVVLSFLPRVVNAARNRQSWLSVALHPVDVVLLLGVRWYGLLRGLPGRSGA